MASDAPTIAETIDEIQAALREYIEATYHVGHPTIIEQRRQLLTTEGVLFKAPYIESTPRYQTNRRFAELDLDPAGACAVRAAHPEDRAISTAAVRPAVHPPGRGARVDSRGTARAWRSRRVPAPERPSRSCLPMLAKLATEAAHRPSSFEAPAVRALILYPMNALVNDQLGRLRLLLGDPRVTTQFDAWAGRPARFARYTSRTLYPGVRTVKKDQQRLGSIEDFYLLLIDQAADPTAPGHVQAMALKEKLQERGKWPAKPDLKAWFGPKGTRWKDPKTGEFVRAVTRPDDPELLTRHEVLGSTAGRPHHQLLDAGVHADAAAGAAGLRSHPPVACRQPGGEVPSGRRRGAPLPRSGRSRGRAAASSLALAARHHTGAPAGHHHQRQLHHRRIRPVSLPRN